MKSDELNGTWKNLRGIAEEKWGRSTDDDLDVAEGMYDQLVGRIQERYGSLEEAANPQVDAWLEEL